MSATSLSSPASVVRVGLGMRNAGNSRRIRLRRRARSKPWLLLMAAVLVGCSRGDAKQPARNEPGQRATIEKLLGGRSGVLVTINPANCAMGAALARTLNRIATHGRVRVQVAFVGVAPDPAQHARIREDLGLEAASITSTLHAVQSAIGMSSATQPFAVYVVNGKVRAALFAESLGSLESWIDIVAPPRRI